MAFQTLTHFVLLVVVPHVTGFPQAPPVISPTDDSNRIIPAEQHNPEGGHEDVNAQLCGTAPPPESLRDMHVKLETARTHEKRGLSHYVDDMGLEKRASNMFMVETYFHLVTTTDQARYFSPTTRTQVINNQV